MNLSKTDLKKIIYDFNCASNRLMRADHEEYLTILRKYITSLTGNSLIHDYLMDCGKPTIDIESEVGSILRSYGNEIFGDLGETERNEDANIFGILNIIVEKGIEVQYGLALGYSSSNKYQDKLKGFNERIVMVMIRHIEAYLTKIGIDMGWDETVKYNITVTNGQVNVANDNATINATLNNGINNEKLQQLLLNVKKACDLALSAEDAEVAHGSLEVIHEELSGPKPRRRFIQTAITALGAIKGSAEFAAAVIALVQFLQNIA